MRILILFTGIVFSIQLNGQSFLELVEGNKNWRSFILTAETKYTTRISICGDTTIQNKNYKKLNYSTGIYKSALREDNGKVYWIDNDQIEEILLYDFTLPVSDTFHYKINGTTTFQVLDSISTELLYGTERRVFHFDTGAQWIEGIGSTSQLLWIDLSFSILLYCLKDEIPIYCLSDIECENANFIECDFETEITEIEPNANWNIFPNPTNRYLNIELGGTNSLSRESIFEIHDVAGRLIKRVINRDRICSVDLGELPEGIYLLKMIRQGNPIEVEKIVVSKL